jgi:vanillate O-demethylase monooxygenase subunit
MGPISTPENAHSTHYFFTAIRFGVRTEDEAFNRSMQTKVAAMRRFAFEDQDAPVIEAQQRNLNSASRVLNPVLLECDAGPARYQRVLRQLIKAESGG